MFKQVHRAYIIIYDRKGFVDVRLGTDQKESLLFELFGLKCRELFREYRQAFLVSIFDL